MTREVALKIAMDVTPLLGNPTGIGRYVGSLLGALADHHGRVRAEVSPGADVPDAELRGVAFTARRRTGLSSRLPPGVRTVGPPVPARALQWSWARTELPSITAITGRVELFHGTNFVLPPTGRAAGVVTVHDLSFLRTPQTVSRASLAYRTLVPRSIGRAAVVCVPSQAVAAEVADEYRLPPDRIAVTPLGVDPAWGSAAGPDPERRRRLGLPADYLVFSGSLEPRKNLPLLLEAQRRLRTEDPEWPTLVLLGPPGWGPQLDLGALPAGAVHLTGYLDDEDLRSVVAGARALVYPSLYEGFGLPPLEAFACGVPVIASDLPVIREVVGDDPTLARLVPSGDLDALTAALHAQVFANEDPEVAVRRRRRAEHFTWEVTAQRTWDAYRRALTAW